MLATVRIIVAALALYSAAGTLAAQECPSCYMVEVTPDGSTVNQSLSSRDTVEFIVTNTGSLASLYTFTCSSTGGISCVSVSPTSATIQPDGFRRVTVIYDVGASFGEVRLTASGGAVDMGYFVVSGPGGPSVALRNLNSDHQDRSLCLTTAAGEGMATQCGDLLAAHGLPAYRTMGRDRSLTLVYNSATAAPRPAVAAWITLPYLTAQPDSVYAELKINDVTLASGWYFSWNSGVRQIVVAAPADTFTTGIYPFTLLARHKYAGGVHDSTKTGELLIVNRRNSVFGSGWWLAGVEQLKLGQSANRILWTGADGSAVVYDSVAAGVWRRAAGAFRDTLARFDSASATWYRRTLRHRVHVTYDATGRHVRTTNRVGHATRFYWGTNLDSIVVPPGGTGTRYALTYNGGRLDAITDPAGRVLNATVASDTTLTLLIDPDGDTVTLGYASKRVSSRANRRGYTTYVDYDSALRVTKVRAPANAGTDTTRFSPWDQLGLTVGVVAGRRPAGDTTLSYTSVDGPRDVLDVSKFWVDRWGAPVQVVGMVADTTQLLRGAAAHPALVTRVRYPDGRIVGAEYDGRTNPTVVADSTYEGSGATQTVRTTYVYGNTAVPDSPTEVQGPVDTLRFKYDTSLGLPDTAIAHNGHRTRFEYFTSPATRGLLYRVTELAVPVVDTTAWTKSNANLVTRMEYDAWGNDTLVVAPKGDATRYVRDSVRRVIRTDDALGHRTDYVYDALNHITEVKVFDTDTFRTRYSYSPSGAIDSVFDPRNVQRVWQRGPGDQLVRLIDETPDTAISYYGRGGLLDSVKTRNGNAISYRYDLAGRLLVTKYLTFFNDFPGTADDYIAMHDSIMRTYDVMGRLVKVTNATDTIVRTYNREGTLRSERQSVASGASNFLTQILYDAGGRRTQFHTVGLDTLSYSYGPDGQLKLLKVRWATGQPADSFLFYWDALGRRDSLVYPNGAYVGYGYDANGHLRLVCSRHQPNTNTDDHLEYRLYYRKLDADGLTTDLLGYAGGSYDPDCGDHTGSTAENQINFYDGRHQLVNSTKTYAYDKSGNRVSSRSSAGTLDSLTYAAGSNQLQQRYTNPATLLWDFHHYPDGSRHWDEPNGFCCSRFFYYNALGQTIGVLSYQGGWQGGPDLCRYDPLGRRYRECGNVSPGWAGFDGDNVIRLHGAQSTPNWRFVHGPGLDDPLVGLRNVSGTYTKYYYLTDGRGRQLAFTDASGIDRQSELVYTQNGGNQAGGITESHDFGNSRSESSEAPALSFYRNRYYDQQTGRFTQEDPIGIAGGVNLYQYAGNNPVAFTDPFGLKVCFKGTKKEVGKLKSAAEDATDSNISLDKKNCVKSVQSRGHKEFDHIRRRFQGLVDDTKHTFGVAFTQIASSEQIDPYRIDVYEHADALAYPATVNGQCKRDAAAASFPQVVGHELAHHYPQAVGLPMSSEEQAMQAENVYLSFAGKPPRCAY